ncbi:MAG: carbamoyltransferase [Bacteroidota bacterium]
MYILGISAYYHDAAAALIRDGEIIAAAQEERFSRIKHDPQFPSQAISYCLEEAGIGLNEVDAIVFYDKPLLKFERLLETYYAYAPKGFRQFVKSIPIWIKEKLFLKSTLRKELTTIGEFNAKNIPLLFPEHHLSHAASAFYPSPFEDAAILSVDGVGEWATTSIMHGKGQNIELKKQISFPHSLGLLYSSFTYFLGFKVNSGEYKLMGLAPYGNPHSEQKERFKQIIRGHLITSFPDGSFQLNISYFSYPYGLRMIQDKDWVKLFGISKREPEAEILQEHCNLALAIQEITEDIMIALAKEAQRLTGSNYLCIAGGVALNCVANGKLLDETDFEEIYVQPAAGDAGASLGAALAAFHIHFKQARSRLLKDSMKNAYLGPSFSLDEIRIALQEANLSYSEHTDESLFDYLSDKLTSGMVVGWFQGRMEFGPRALGNRSILADPANIEMQRIVNIKIKNRESFRPFAPVFMEGEIPEYFELKQSSPYMSFVRKLKSEHLHAFPTDYYEWSMKEKLAFKKSELAAITHVDGSARVQSLRKSANPRFYSLLQSIKAKTGRGVLLNTSFNVRGEPIVCKPKEAIHCFQKTEMDVLVLENFIVEKKLYKV